MRKDLCLTTTDELIANSGLHFNDLIRFPNVFDVSIQPDLHGAHVEATNVMSPLNLITNVDTISPSTSSCPGTNSLMKPVAA